MAVRLLVLALVAGACSGARPYEFEPENRCGGVLGVPEEAKPAALEPAECPSESPLKVEAGCPPTMHTESEGGPCVALETPPPIPLLFDDTKSYPEDLRASVQLGGDK